MPRRLAAPLLFATLLTAATPAPTLVRYADNVLDSMQDASGDLSTLLAGLRRTGDQLRFESGQAALLALHQDALQVDASCDALALKAARLVEIAQELTVEVGVEGVQGG